MKSRDLAVLAAGVGALYLLSRTGRAQPPSSATSQPSSTPASISTTPPGLDYGRLAEFESRMVWHDEWAKPIRTKSGHVIGYTHQELPYFSMQAAEMRMLAARIPGTIFEGAIPGSGNKPVRNIAVVLGGIAYDLGTAIGGAGQTERYIELEKQAILEGRI